MRGGNTMRKAKRPIARAGWACLHAQALLVARSIAALAQLVEHRIRNAGVRCSSHLSGTTTPQIIEKQPFYGMALPNCSTEVSHIDASEGHITHCNLTINEAFGYSTRLYHRRIPRLSGLWRRGAIYQYRVRVPVDLAGSLRKTHINRSLQTASINVARRCQPSLA